MPDVFFYIFAMLPLLCGATALGNPFSRNPVTKAIFLFSCLAGTHLQAEVLALNELGAPFYSSSLKIVWAAPTNELPAQLTIYKTAPASFSPTVVSNLMRLASLTEADRVDKTKDPSTFRFRSSDGKRSLTIIPGRGVINFRDQEAVGKAPQGIPDPSQALHLGKKILNLLEIDSNQLAQKDGELQPAFRPETRNYFDKAQQKHFKELVSVGIRFPRCFDGILSTRQDIYIRFGEHAKLLELKLDWKGVTPAKSFPVADKELIMRWIREGRARGQFLQTTGAREIAVSQIRRLTIKKISLRYLAKDTDKLEDEIIPFALLGVEAELSKKEKETFYIFSPVISFGLPEFKRDIFSSVTVHQREAVQ